MNQVSARLAELKATIDAGSRHRDSMLSMISHQVEPWILMVQDAIICCYEIFNRTTVETFVLPSCLCSGHLFLCLVKSFFEAVLVIYL